MLYGADGSVASNLASRPGRGGRSLKPRSPWPPGSRAFKAVKFNKGDEIAIGGTVTMGHDEEYGRRRMTVRLESFDCPITVSDEYVDLVASAEKPPAAKKPARRKGPLFDGPD